MLGRSSLRCSNKYFQNDSYLIIADFIKKIAFIQVVKIFGFFQNSIAIITELDEINVRKKQNLFLVLTLAPKYSTIPRKNIMKVLSELRILIFKLKVGKCIVFSKTPIFELVRALEENRQTLINTLYSQTFPYIFIYNFNL